MSDLCPIQTKTTGRPACQSTPAPSSIPRELHQPHNSSQAGFLTRVLPKAPSHSAITSLFSKIIAKQWVFAFRTSDYRSKQTLTAAGRSRFSTEFPFIYPKALALGPAITVFLFQRTITALFYRSITKPATKK
jgi:hypothetical protein